MDEQPSPSGGIQSSIPQELQNEIDFTAVRRPRKEATQLNLDENQKRWLVVGICLHSFVTPALRKYAGSNLTILHNELVCINKIDTQIFPTHLRKDPHTGAWLNYEAVNNNKAMHGKNIAKYDYTIKDAADLSKLFLPTHMAHYKSFDETCDSSALLGMILNIAKFPPVIKSDADYVRTHIRNPWAHCNFTEWDAIKYSNSFQLMKKLVMNLKLKKREETLIIEEMEKWEKNGKRYLNGTSHGLELINKFRQETHALAVYAKSAATETNDNYKRVKNELQNFEIIIRNEIAQLKDDTTLGFLEIDKKLEAQGKALKNKDTQIEELHDYQHRCACHDSHNFDIDFWKKEDVIFVETPAVKVVSQIIETKHKCLIVGEPGIGKSMLMHHIALKLHDKSEYIIIPCSGIKDILYHYKEDKRQIFVLDDICGRFTVSINDTGLLLKNEETLLRILEKGKSNIVATCRLDIYNDDTFRASCSVFTSIIFDLSKEYSKEDKLTICAKFLSETNMQLLKDQAEPFTPLMGYLYSKNENFCLTDFLHSPYETYRNEWEKLQSIDPYKYCTLFLCVIFNGIIKESLFDIYNETHNMEKNVLKNIFDICGVNRGTSFSQMKKVLDQVIGTYLLKTKNEYRVIHDQMFDFICYYFGNKDTLVRALLRYADIAVVNERTQLESINELNGKFTIIISKDYEKNYFARIKKDLQCGKLNQCFCSAQMKFERYRALFLSVLKSIEFDYQLDHHILQHIIMISCFRGYADIVEYLISKDVDLDKGYSHFTPLEIACLTRNKKIAQLLIDNGCAVNQIDGMFETPLTIACNIGDEKIVQLLIDKGCDINQVDGMFEAPLTVACTRGNEKIVHLLIDKGCDMNQVDRMYETPLIAACRMGNEKIVHLLIDKGCDINQVGVLDTPLTSACYSGNEKIVQLLIDKGCDINQGERMSETPLIAACKIGNEKIVQLLLDKGCDINQVGVLKTPLTSACNSVNKKIVQLLIDKGGDVNQVDGMGETPLTSACKEQFENIVKLRIEKEYDVNQVDCRRDTPLTAAFRVENEKIVQFLIDKGGDINQVCGKGDTPLTAACKGDNEKIVQILLDKGGYINQVDGMGNTPLTAARMMGNTKIAQLLKDKGCDVIDCKIDGKDKNPLKSAYLLQK